MRWFCSFYPHPCGSPLHPLQHLLCMFDELFDKLTENVCDKEESSFKLFYRVKSTKWALAGRTRDMAKEGRELHSWACRQKPSRRAECPQPPDIAATGSALSPNCTVRQRKSPRA